MLKIQFSGRKDRLLKERVTSAVGVRKSKVTAFLSYFHLNSWATARKWLRTEVRPGLCSDDLSFPSENGVRCGTMEVGTTSGLSEFPITPF